MNNIDIKCSIGNHEDCDKEDCACVCHKMDFE